METMRLSQIIIRELQSPLALTVPFWRKAGIILPPTISMSAHKKDTIKITVSCGPKAKHRFRARVLKHVYDGAFMVNAI
jgi:hypothetical protein